TAERRERDDPPGALQRRGARAAPGARPGGDQAAAELERRPWRERHQDADFPSRPIPDRTRLPDPERHLGAVELRVLCADPALQRPGGAILFPARQLLIQGPGHLRRAEVPETRYPEERRA